ncbi:hypothetical protein BTM25_18710 [Actinomadura rubteroloni]|uniref:Uncharacterized protein n=1 Tax=Actinomadura rubteroloni TaxID=1926885 RepID=A0A2P4UQY8_9ACTN|nr:hypothetical protein [Actinomadura rubteroloni]POM27456.1 hypothetical protein BTM25_18710 [Actinomadura rubteroloni]
MTSDDRARPRRLGCAVVAAFCALTLLALAVAVLLVVLAAR